MSLTIPFGKNKGKPLAEADDSDLAFMAKAIAESLSKGDKPQFKARNEELLAGVKAEIARRKAGGQKQDAPETQLAVARAAEPVAIVPIHDPCAVTSRLREMSARYHVVSPATRVDALPPGCGVGMSLVLVDPASDDVYQVSGGKVGLSGTSLKRIGAAAGINWDASQSRRLDDGRDPRYCHYVAVGRVKNFDGSERTVSGEVEMDLRDGSPQVLALQARAEEKARKSGKPVANVDGQVRDMRLFILRHAETKAKLRAIADMGLRRSYTAAELAKPFAVFSLVWTGHTDDPELKIEAFRMQHEQMTRASTSLYGRPPREALPQARAGHSAPPVGSSSDMDAIDVDDWSEDGPPHNEEAL
jgi:hypothetical protein